MKILSIGYIGDKLCCLSPSKTRKELVEEYARREFMSVEEVETIIKTTVNFYREEPFSDFFGAYEVYCS